MTAERKPPAFTTYTLEGIDKCLFLRFVPPITSITFFSGRPPLDVISNKVSEIVNRNPWLAGNLKSKGVQGLELKAPVPVKEHPLPVSDFLTLFPSSSLSSTSDYTTIRKTLSSTRNARAASGLLQFMSNKKQKLFKIAIFDNPEANEFAMVMSMCHILGDGSTYYAIYNMLDASQPVKEMNFARFPDAVQKMRAIIRDESNKTVICKVGFHFGFPAKFAALAAFGKGSLQRFKVFSKDQLEVGGIKVVEFPAGWVETQKQNCAIPESGDFVTTNDVLTSWFFNMCEAEHACMLVNMRAKLGLDANYAGNYYGHLMYQRGDFENAYQIRQSMKGSTFERQSQGAFNKPSGFRMKIASISNLSGLIKDIKLIDDGVQLIKHVPVIMEMQPGYGAYAFAPRKGKLAMVTNIDKCIF